MPQFQTLVELVSLHKKNIEDHLELIDEMIELTQADWDKSNTKKGNISRARELRSGLERIKAEKGRLDLELGQALNEILNYSTMKSDQVKQRRSIERGS